MTKILKKEKINYLKGAKTYLDNLSFDNNNNNNMSSNNINTTLTNISNQLKNIAVDKNKQFKLLNSSNRANNKNTRNNIIYNNMNHINVSSLNLDNNQNHNFFELTANSEFPNQKFQNLQKMRVFNFFILKTINNDNINFDEIKNENDELKENVKFLLKQIKKYQKIGLTIDDADDNKQQEIQNIKKELNDLKQEINTYKNKIISLNNSNKELVKVNGELKNFINISLKTINLQKEKEYNIINNNIKRKKKEFNSLKNKHRGSGGFDQYDDIDRFEEKNSEYKNLKTVFNNYDKKIKNFIDYDNYDDNHSKLSEELFADINNKNMTINDNNKYSYNKAYSNHINRVPKPRINVS
jgi:chromosome segregation protein